MNEYTILMTVIGFIVLSLPIIKIVVNINSTLVELNMTMKYISEDNHNIKCDIKSNVEEIRETKIIVNDQGHKLKYHDDILIDHGNKLSQLANMSKRK